ncbi:MAG: hypothetical protein CFH06_00269 [Alphaproteobacteria bacterium MarineAlpha3_Bin5]|nr:MAG: hypothetical protein CFH06_00269 [Alphaproteobacteria bacterium MarineAlpha3_Bin5]
MRKLVILFGLFLLGGCAPPVPVQIASWILDGVSLVATQKSVTDHGISIVAQQDCALFRGFTDGYICRTWEGEPSDLFAYWEEKYFGDHTGARLSDKHGDQYALWEKSKPMAKNNFILEFSENIFDKSNLYNAHLSNELYQRHHGFSYWEKHQINDVEDNFVQTANVHEKMSRTGLQKTNVLMAALPTQQFKADNLSIAKIYPDQFVAEPKGHITKRQTKENYIINTKPQKVSKLTLQQSASGNKKKLNQAKKEEPSPGFYLVIGSFRNATRAHKLSEAYSNLKADVLAARLNDRITFRVVVGPFMSRQESSIRRALFNVGIKKPWAIKVEPGDWISTEAKENKQLALVPDRM